MQNYFGYFGYNPVLGSPKGVPREHHSHLPTGAIRPSCHAAHERLSGPSSRGVAASGRRHRRYVALTKAIARSRPPCAMRPSMPLSISSFAQRQQDMMSSSRRIRAARPWQRSRTWIRRELGSSSRARVTRFRPLVHPLGKPDGLFGRVPLCEMWVEFRKSEQQIPRNGRGDHGRTVS